MPLVRISLRRGKSSAHIAALRNGIYQAMRETFNVPENDCFILVSQHDADEFDYDPNYLGIARSDDLVIVQITCNSGRTVAQKQALYRGIVENFFRRTGLRPKMCSSIWSRWRRRTGRSAMGSRSTREVRSS